MNKLFKDTEFTKSIIEYSDSLRLNSRSYFYEIEDLQRTQKYIVAVTFANGCKLGGCDINGSALDEEFEVFYIYSLYSISGELIEVKILDYQSDYGYEITSKWWLKQFVKKQESFYEYGKNIDAISGATTSVKSTIKEMNQNKLIISEITGITFSK